MKTPFWSTVLVHQYGPEEINKNIWSSPFVSQRFLFTRELAYVRINISSNTWNGYTAENQEERLFFQRDNIPILASRTVKTREVQIAVFST